YDVGRGQDVQVMVAEGDAHGVCEGRDKLLETQGGVPAVLPEDRYVARAEIDHGESIVILGDAAGVAADASRAAGRKLFEQGACRVVDHELVVRRVRRGHDQ